MACSGFSIKEVFAKQNLGESALGGRTTNTVLYAVSPSLFKVYPTFLFIKDYAKFVKYIHPPH
jgi:hypothetical protein